MQHDQVRRGAYTEGYSGSLIAGVVADYSHTAAC